MSVAIIVAYFGKFTSYYQLFLDSCRSNPDYDWLVFTDDETWYDYPVNVHRIKMDFKECQELIQSRFDFPVSIASPQKLCDYKCAYGVIFEQYLKEYQWWGHCDLDQIFGDLSSFITEEMLRDNDKLFSLGHLTLYRNTYDNNRVFLTSFRGRERYKEVFSTNRGCGFDEWLPISINDLYLVSGRSSHLECLGADINPYKTTFQTVHFNVMKRRYEHSDCCNSIFDVRNGHIYQLYNTNQGICEKEYPYVHLQKRKMKDSRGNKSGGDYYIIPNRFVDKSNNPRSLLCRSAIYRIVNFQFFKVKMNSLKYRIKNSDWNFTSVFR